MKKNIILQHFEAQAGNIGKPMPEIVQKSSANIRKYAERLDAEYRLLDGHPFQKALGHNAKRCVQLTKSMMNTILWLYWIRISL